MKNKLQSLIRKAIQEVLSEGETIDVSNPNMTDQQKAALIQQARSATKDSTLGTAKKPVSFVEGELNEMAGANYKLADDYQDKLSELPYFNSAKRMVWVNGIIDYLNDVGSSDVTKIANEKFNVPQPRIADYARDMIRLGIMEPAVAGFVPKFMRADDEDGGEEEITGPDAFLIGNSNLDKFFDGRPNADGTEDFTPETEPELPVVKEPFKAVGPVAKAAEFTINNDRLIDKIIKLYGASKLRVREAFGELSGADFAKAEKERKDIAISQLPELIQQLADEISMEDKETQAAILNILAKKFASVNYSSLSKKVAAALGTAAPQVQEPEMDDLGLGDDESEIEPLDEYTKRKLQFYAGIIK
jgi:hypothetical protein